MNKELLDRYFAGQCSEEEVQQIEHWLGRHEALPDVGTPAGKGIKKAIWQPLHQKITAERPKSAHLFSLYKKLAVAAAVLAVISVAGYVISLRVRDQKTLVSWETVSNPGGRIMKIELPDNSIVQLNGGATLTYPSAFADVRMVKLLSGEAFFDIARDDAHPFSVATEGAGHIAVLGTSFNVKHRAGAPSLQVTLRSGKVRFDAPNQPVQYLAPGEQLEYILANQQVKAPIKADTTAICGWTTGILRFNETPVEEVLATLETYYGVAFIIRQKPTPQAISARFNNKSLQEILLLIEKTTDVKFKQEGDRIIVTK